MKKYLNPGRESWPEIITRPVMDQQVLTQRVKEILDAVKAQGDEALLKYTEKFDQVSLQELRVPHSSLETAESLLAPELIRAIQVARNNIEAFHRTQKETLRKVETMPGVVCWRKSVPIQRVGIYIPGGTAPLFSTILMLAVPAQLAGCEQIVLCTPPHKDKGIHPAILFTAHLLGITEVFQVGGAQAIAAMAYGTDQIPQVDKIFGPGNQYVTLAKQLVSQEGVAIDMPAGPSEVAIVADEKADPSFVAADLLSQAEHGTDSQVLLLTPHESLFHATQEALETQLAALPRADIAKQALKNSACVILESWDDIADLTNAYAPEHLILSMENSESFGEKVINAGSVFLGYYTPESLGDYASGTNHTLPTNGYARAYSGVSLDSFVKKITFQQVSAEGLKRLGPTVEVMAEAEQLMAHKSAISIRLKSIEAQALPSSEAS